MVQEKQYQVERRRLADQIADRLIKMIGDGTLKAGDRLPSEPELMKQFNVGRSSIREAIGALSLTGVLTVRPGQGTHVASFSSATSSTTVGLLGIGPEKVQELVEARIELESIIARLAAERATREEIDEIREAHNALGDSVTKNEELIKRDLRFHIAIAKACHNSVLIKFFSEMRQPTRNWMEQKAKYDWGYQKVYEQHDLIVKAIEARDSTQAEQALRTHLQSTGEKLVAAILESSEK